MKDEIMDKNEAIAAVASKVTYTGASGAVFFGLTANELAALGGLGLAVIGLIVNTWFKYLQRKDLREHHKRMEDKSTVA